MDLFNSLCTEVSEYLLVFPMQMIIQPSAFFCGFFFHFKKEVPKENVVVGKLMQKRNKFHI